MNAPFEQYKSSFTESLLPFFEMLEHQKAAVSLPDWLQLVHNLTNHVIENPEQYLAPDFPSPVITKEVILEIFEEFVSRHVESTEVTLQV